MLVKASRALIAQNRIVPGAKDLLRQSPFDDVPRKIFARILFPVNDFVYGDRKKYLTALLTLSPEEIGKWAAENGIAERDPAKLASEPRVVAMMSARVEEMNRSLASFEQIKKFALLGTDFSQETGELTPTLKVKRKVVLQKYGTLLDALYEKE